MKSEISENKKENQREIDKFKKSEVIVISDFFWAFPSFLNSAFGYILHCFKFEII